MTRVLLACLLLTACAAKDPAGTLTLKPQQGYMVAPSILIERQAPGDSAPLRLQAGDYALIVDRGEDTTAETATTCAVQVELMPYPDGAGRVIYQSPALAYADTRVNGIRSGLYFFRVTAPDPACTVDLNIGTA